MNTTTRSRSCVMHGAQKFPFPFSMESHAHATKVRHIVLHADFIFWRVLRKFRRRRKHRTIYCTSTIMSVLPVPGQVRDSSHCQYAKSFLLTEKDTMTPKRAARRVTVSPAHVHSTLVAKQIYATLRTANRTTPCRCSSSPEPPCETPIQSARQKHCRTRPNGARRHVRARKLGTGRHPTKATKQRHESRHHRRVVWSPAPPRHYCMPFPRKAGAPVQARPLGKKAERETSSSSSSSDPPNTPT
jgi:hypothetical protein